MPGNYMQNIACMMRKNTDNTISFDTVDGPATGVGPIGAHKWGKQLITYCLVLASGQAFIDIPNTHDIFKSVNFAYTSWGLFCGLKFKAVPYNQNPDITIKFDANDPAFVDATGKQTGVLGYTYYPNTKPVGSFTMVLNPSYLWSENNVSANFSMDINNLIRHEAGHSIGCVHTTGLKDIMYYMYNGETRQKDEDILQVTTMYGPRVPAVNPIEIDGFFKSTIKTA